MRQSHNLWEKLRCQSLALSMCKISRSRKQDALGLNDFLSHSTEKKESKGLDMFGCGNPIH